MGRDWDEIICRILALQEPESGTLTSVTINESPYPKYVNDKVVGYAGVRPTGYDGNKIAFEISKIDEKNPNPNKRLGKWFQTAWLLICVIRGEMYDWHEILEEIKIVAKWLKKNCARVNDGQDQNSYRMNKK